MALDKFLLYFIVY